MYRRLVVFSCSLLLVLTSLGCGSKPTADQADSREKQKAPGLIDRLTARPAVVPAGAVITVRLGRTLGSRTSNNGDSFDATAAEPVQINGKTVVPFGVPASGHVPEAAPEGRLKGGARLRLVLDSVTVNGIKYDIQTSSVSRSLKGKGKRTATMIGGGTGAGALIGGLAGGGKGALIGAALGAGAGTAGAAYTGNKDITVPAESALSFKLAQPITVKM